jgi:hypothetical protein
MKALTKYLAGAATAVALTVTAASPAQAQIFGRDDPYGRNRGIDVGDIVTGVAVLGGIAAITRALGQDGGRYGYDNRYRYRDDYSQAVNACGYQAERYGQGGRISVTDVERRGSNSYRVRGVIDAGYGSYGSNAGYGRYEPRDDRYGRYEPRVERYDRYDTRVDRYGRNDRYGSNYGRYDQRVEFACTARSNGRVTDFDIDRRY